MVKGVSTGSLWFEGCLLSCWLSSLQVKKKHVLGQNNLELYLQSIAEVYMTYTIHIFTYMLKIIILLLPWLWVTWWVSYNWKELLTLRQHLRSNPPVGSMLLIVLVFALSYYESLRVVFSLLPVFRRRVSVLFALFIIFAHSGIVLCFCFVFLCFVASFSGLSIFDWVRVYTNYVR